MLISIFAGTFTFNTVYADAWFGQGSGNGSANPCKGNDCGNGASWDIYSAGVSWIHYSPREGLEGHIWEAQPPYDGIDLTPNTGLGKVPNSEARISATDLCKESGFWHFGWNAQGIEAHHLGVDIPAYFLNPEFTYWQDDWFSYSTRVGGWGHVGTYAWGYLSNHSVPYKTHGDGELDHCLYSNDDRLYCADHYSTSYTEDCGDPTKCVWTAYKQAWQEAHPGQSAPAPGDFQSNVFAFCSSSSNTKRKITVKYVVVSCADFEGREFRTETIEPEGDSTEVTVTADAQIQDNGRTYGFNSWGGDNGYRPNPDGRTLVLDVSNGNKTVIKRYYDPNVDCSGEPEPDPGTSSCAQWTPSSYTSSNELSGTTSVVSAARNLSISNQNSEWHGSGNAENGPSLVAPSSYVYAKPTDRVAWLHCYFPGVQTTINSTVSHNNIHEEDKNMSGFVDSSIQNHTFQEYGGWENRFSVSSNNLVSHTIANASGNFSLGDTSVHEVPDDYTVEVSHLRAGLELKESIQTGFPVNASTNNTGVHSWSCHWYESNDAKCGSDCVSYTWEDVTNDEGEVTGQRRVCASWRPRSCYGDTCYHDKDFWSNSHGGTTSDNAIVKVPYNYENSSTVGLSGSILYSGEKVQINSLDTKVKVDTRNNFETAGDYATQVPDAKVRFIAYISATDDSGRPEQRGVGNASDGNDNSHGLCRFLNVKPSTNRCEQLDSDDKTLNPDAEYGGVETTVKFSGGTYNVFDEAAGNYFCVVSAVYPYTVADDRDMEKKGSDNWYISQPSCLIMAKKPAFQVWGAGIFSAGNINTVVSTKNNIKNYVNWGPTGGTEYTFGSWGELSVTLAKPGSSDTIASGASTGYRGGLPSAGYPYSGSPGGLSGTSFCTRNPLTIANTNCNASVGNANLDTLLSTLTTDREVIRNRFNASGGDITVNNYPGGTTISNVEVGYAQTIVDIIDGDAIIGEGLRYADSYSTIYQIPKHIIYASGNMTIGCDVQRIDAILIAGGTVNTCNNGDANSRDRSNQLVVNGAVIANRFSFNRSFGTGTGGYSISPAELINYDSSIYLWANRSASGAFSGQLTETASRELAPRY